MKNDHNQHGQSVNPNKAFNSGYEFSEELIAKSAQLDCLSEGYIKIKDGADFISYGQLFGKYLAGASEIHLVDPYINQGHHVANLVRFISEALDSSLSRGMPTLKHIHLTTQKAMAIYPDDSMDVAIAQKRQEQMLMRAAKSFATLDVTLTYNLVDSTDRLHDRYAELSNGWDIIMGRGLDFYKWIAKEEAHLVCRATYFGFKHRELETI